MEKLLVVDLNAKVDNKKEIEKATKKLDEATQISRRKGNSIHIQEIIEKMTIGMMK